IVAFCPPFFEESARSGVLRERCRNRLHSGRPLSQFAVKPARASRGPADSQVETTENVEVRRLVSYTHIGRMTHALIRSFSSLFPLTILPKEARAMWEFHAAGGAPRYAWT